MMAIDDLPDYYTDICPTIREELEESFGVYFNEELAEMFIRSVYDDDEVAYQEMEQEANEFITQYLLDKLQDEV